MTNKYTEKAWEITERWVYWEHHWHATKYIAQALESAYNEGVERGGKRAHELEAARFAYASEFDGDVGSIHQNIRELKSKLQIAVEALKEIASDDFTSPEASGCHTYPDLCEAEVQHVSYLAETALAKINDNTQSGQIIKNEPCPECDGPTIYKHECKACRIEWVPPDQVKRLAQINDTKE